MEQNNNTRISDYEYFRVITLTADNSLAPDTILCMWGAYVYLKEKCLEEELDTPSGNLDCPVVEKYLPFLRQQFIVDHLKNLHSDFYHYYVLHDQLFINVFDRAVYQAKLKNCWIFPKEIVAAMTGLFGGEKSNLLVPFSGLSFYPGDFDNCQNVTVCEEEPAQADIFGIRRSLVETDSYTCRQITPNELLSANGNYDGVLAFPPIATGRGKLEIDGEEFDNHIQLLVNIFGNKTTANAEMALLVPSRFLTNPNLKNCREEMVDNNWLETIICLPANLLGTATTFAILHLSKNRQKEQELRFLDASKMFEKDQHNLLMLDYKWIGHALAEKENEHIVKTSCYQVARNNYNLLMSDYAETLLEDETHEVLNLEKCLTSVQSRANYEGEMPVVQPKNLSGHPFSEAIDTNKLDLLPCMEAFRVTERALLVSKAGGIRTGICNASEENPVYINRMVMALAPTNNYSFDLDYLRLCISKLKFADNAMPFVTPQALGEKRISLPISVKEQHNVYVAEQDNWFKAIESKYSLSKLINSKCESVKEEKEQTVQDIRLHLCNIKAIGRLIENSIKQKEKGFDTYILEKVKQLNDEVNDLILNKLNKK